MEFRWSVPAPAAEKVKVKVPDDELPRLRVAGTGPETRLKAPLPTVPAEGEMLFVATPVVWTSMMTVNHCPTLAKSGGWLT
jgi:hypothetical protein